MAEQALAIHDAKTQVTAQTDNMVSMIERVAMDPNLPIDRLTALMDMRERQMDKEAEQVFNQAFAAAMAEMPDIPKSGLNKHSGQKYSTLDDLIRTTRPVLARHGLSLNWQTSVAGNDYSVTAIVRHAMGHSIETTLNGARDTGKQMNALQGGGSTETYLKRYTGFSILGLSSGDEVEDDGRASGKAPPEPARHPSWAQTITQDMDPNSTPRQKAEAVADAICAQWGRKKSEKQLFNEWDRRADLIEGDEGLEGKYPDLHEKVIDAYELRLMEIKDAAE